jgi:ABC-type uncharacterized transport system auxiliary subunit
VTTRRSKLLPGIRRSAMAALMMMAACGKMPTMHYYDLRYPAAVDNAPSSFKYSKTIAISSFTAPALYRQNRVLYREGNTSNKVGYYDDRRWASPPTELLTQAALTQFRNSRLFANVIPFSDRSGCDYVLRARIVELEEIDLPDGYQGRVTLQAELLAADNGRVIWSGPVTATRKTTLKDVNAVVEEIAGSARDALANLIQAVDRAISPSASK